MQEDISKIAAILILLALIAISIFWMISQTRDDPLNTTDGQISPKCGGFEAISLCTKACYQENKCDETHCDPDNGESMICRDFLDYVQNTIVVEALPKEVKFAGSATITVRTTDSNKSPVEAELEASGVGSGKAETSGGTAIMTIPLKKAGALTITAKPKDDKFRSSSAVVLVVK